MLTDTHCHLYDGKFAADRLEVLQRARQVGVARLLIPGVSLDSSRAALALAESHPDLYAAVGIHPSDVAAFDASSLSGLRELARSPRVRAVGEIGLDEYWQPVDRALQQKLLGRQLDLAAALRLPVVLHFREKGDAPDGGCAAGLLKILAAWTESLRRAGNPLAGRPGVLHSFSGSPRTAREALRLGFYLGVTGPVTYRRDRQELVAGLPLDRLLIETDAPYQAPAPRRGERNEPAYVRHIADKIAELHACSAAQVEQVTSASAARLFEWT